MLFAAIVLLAAALAIVLLKGIGITGSDGTAPQRPASSIIRVPGDYRTIQAAVDAAQTGNIIEVRAGTYNETVTLNKAVTLRAGAFDATNPRNNLTVLDGGNHPAAVLIPAGLSRMPSIEGFVIRNSRDGIEAHSPFTAENNYFYGSQWSVEYVDAGGGINRNNVYYNSGDDALHLSNFASSLLVENNKFLYAGDDSIEIDLHGTMPETGELQLDIWNNMLIGSSQDAVKFVEFPDSNALMKRSRVLIAGNLIANNRRAGIGFVRNGNTNEDYSGVDSAERVSVYNNTLYGNDYGISGGDNLVAFNNIFANTVSRGAWRVQGPSGADSVIAYSLFWDNPVDTDQSTLGQGNIFGKDPLFVSTPNAGPDQTWGTADDDFGGLLIPQGSPAMDAGVTQYTAADGERIPATPLTGFLGAAPDLGWRESDGLLAMRASPTPIPSVTAEATPTRMASLPSSSFSQPDTQVTTAARTSLPTSSTVTTGTPPSATASTGTAQTETTGIATQTAASPSATSLITETPAETLEPTATPGELTIDQVVPTQAAAGQTLTLVIAGSGFAADSAVAFEGAKGNPPEIDAVQVVDSTTIIVTMSIPASDTAHRTWDVRVTEADGTTAVLSNAVTINP